jgi:hypothetical protein
MSEFQSDPLIEKLFQIIRKEFHLGMREYLAALDAVSFVTSSGSTREDSEKVRESADLDLQTLRMVLQLIWCHSRSQQDRFGEIWDQIVPFYQKDVADKGDTTARERASLSRLIEPIQPQWPVAPPPPDVPKAVKQPLPVETTPEPKSDFDLAPLPIRAPTIPEEVEISTDLEAYWPISRRSMGYFWRYLRRPRSDGPMNVLDLSATVEYAAKRGVFLGPLYRRSEVNYAHLMLFIDQEGSMMPLHRFTRDLVETAQEDSTLEKLEIYYFYNVPDTHLYEDAALSKPVPLDHALMHCDSDTSVLIVSDAGAARGQRQMRRFRETTMFLAHLKRRTNLIGWLNPMPLNRWSNTTAGLVARMVPMAQMDEEGFSQIIDIIRGQFSAGQTVGEVR